MARKNENRTRNQAINFRVSPDEYNQIQARIKISGMPKAQYFIQSLIHQKICISVGKYQSDRLSLEFKKLRETLENVSENEDIIEILKDCKSLLSELWRIASDNEKLSAENFTTKKKEVNNE